MRRFPLLAKITKKKSATASGSSRGVSYLKGEAPWHGAVRAKGKAAVLTAERRLRDNLKLVRRLYSGFTAAEGFDARRLKHIPDARIQVLNRFAAEALRLTSGEFHELYTLHRPRTSEQRRALILHTGITPPAETFADRKHPQRAWPIYANTRQVKLRYVHERVALGFGLTEERTRVEVRRPVKGGTLVHRDYTFREVLGFQPGLDSTTPEGMRVGRMLGTHDPWIQMLKAMQLLVPRLPSFTRQGNEVYYRLLTDRGPIDTSVPKHMLIDKMQRWAEQYLVAVGLVATLIGVRYVGDEFKAVRGSESMDARSERRRARYRQYAEERAKARGRITRTGALHPLPRKPRKKSKSVKRRKAPGKHK